MTVRARALVAIVGIGAIVGLSTLTTAVVAGAEPSSTTAPQGNVQPALDPPNGTVAVAASGAPVDNRVAVIVQNGSTRSVRIESVTATATRGGGATVTRARTTTTFPQVVAPGAYALATIKFRTGGAPVGSTLTFRVTSTPSRSATDPRALAVRGLVLSPPLTGSVAQTLDATVGNVSTTRVARAPRLAVMCFNEARKPVTLTTAHLDVSKLGPGKTAPGQVPLDTLCPTYVVAASSA